MTSGGEKIHTRGLTRESEGESRLRPLVYDN